MSGCGRKGRMWVRMKVDLFQCSSVEHSSPFTCPVAFAFQLPSHSSHFTCPVAITLQSLHLFRCLRASHVSDSALDRIRRARSLAWITRSIANLRRMAQCLHREGSFPSSRARTLEADCLAPHRSKACIFFGYLGRTLRMLVSYMPSGIMAEMQLLQSPPTPR